MIVVARLLVEVWHFVTFATLDMMSKVSCLGDVHARTMFHRLSDGRHSERKGQKQTHPKRPECLPPCRHCPHRFHSWMVPFGVGDVLSSLASSPLGG